MWKTGECFLVCLYYHERKYYYYKTMSVMTLKPLKPHTQLANINNVLEGKYSWPIVSDLDQLLSKCKHKPLTRERNTFLLTEYFLQHLKAWLLCERVCAHAFSNTVGLCLPLQKLHYSTHYRHLGLLNKIKMIVNVVGCFWRESIRLCYTWLIRNYSTWNTMSHKEHKAGFSVHQSLNVEVSGFM